MKVCLGILLGFSVFVSGCERIPEWERRADKTKSLELSSRLNELRKWVFTCRGKLPQADRETGVGLNRVMDAELEALQDYFRSKNLSSIDTSDSKTMLGTAFLWDSAGHLIVPIQSSSAPKELECRRLDGTWLNASLVGIDSSIDYGVLQLEGFSMQKQENPWLSRSSDLKEDESFFATAVPMAGFLQRFPVSLQAVGYNFNSGMDSDIRAFLPAVSPIFVGAFIVDEKFSVVGFSLPQWSGWTLAISVERMSQSVTSIIRGENLQRPFLGLRVIPEVDQFLVQQVEVGGPAYRAGVRSQDILLEWDGRRLKSLSDWREVTAKDIGRTISLKYKRGSSVFESGLKVGTQD